MMTIDYMVLADAAAAPEGKHYIHGGGWDQIWATRFPTTHPLIAVAFLLRVPWNDANIPQRVELDVVNADGASILPSPPGAMGGPITVGRPAGAVPGNDLLVPFVFNLAMLTFPEPGDYVVTMSIDGKEAKRFPIHLTTMPPRPGIAPIARMERQ